MNQLKKQGSDKKLIAVLCPYKDAFLRWVQEIGTVSYGTNAAFVQIREVADLLGRMFDDGDYGPGWQELPADVRNVLMTRIKKKT